MLARHTNIIDILINRNVTLLIVIIWTAVLLSLMPHHTSVSLQSVFLINSLYVCLALSSSLTTLPFNRTFLSSLLIASMIRLKARLDMFSIYPIPSPFLCFSTLAFCWYLLSLGWLVCCLRSPDCYPPAEAVPSEQGGGGSGRAGSRVLLQWAASVFSTAGGPGSGVKSALFLLICLR